MPLHFFSRCGYMSKPWGNNPSSFSLKKKKYYLGIIFSWTFLFLLNSSQYNHPPRHTHTESSHHPHSLCTSCLTRTHFSISLYCPSCCHIKHTPQAYIRAKREVAEDCTKYASTYCANLHEAKIELKTCYQTFPQITWLVLIQIEEEEDSEQHRTFGTGFQVLFIM